MFPLLGLIGTAAGIGMQLFGASQAEEDANKARKAQKIAANKQYKAGKQTAFLASESARKQNDVINEDIIPFLEDIKGFQEKASEASAKAEKLRNLQMRLDADRTRRDIIRNMLQARSIATSRAFAQGGGQSSGLMGGLSQITSDANRQILGVNQNQEIGQGIFDANAEMSDWLTKANTRQTQINIKQAKMGTIKNDFDARIAMASVVSPGAIPSAGGGAVASSIGSSIIQSLPSIEKLGTSALFGKSSSTPWYQSSYGSQFTDATGTVNFSPLTSHGVTLANDDTTLF